MKYNRQKQRQSIRLKRYDYSSPGAYCITICIQNRACLLGEIHRGVVQLSDAGRMVQQAWLQLPERFPQIALDAFVIMPNHIHGILVLTNPVGASLVGDQNGGRAPTRDAPTESRPILGEVVGAFKSITTHEYAIAVHHHNWEPFDKRLWQRNYYEHIVRSEERLQTLREYILNNPTSWELDQLYPHSLASKYL